MPFLRTPAALSSFTRRAAPSALRLSLISRPLSFTPARFAQGYGDGKGNLKVENPQEQGSSNARKHDAEHPGPTLPVEGHGSGAGPTNGPSGKSAEESLAKSGESGSKDAKETGSSLTGGSVGQSGGKEHDPKDGAAPKIQGRKEIGGGNTQEKQVEVEKHNRDIEQGHDRALKPPSEDKVDKKFFKGKF